MELKTTYLKQFVIFLAACLILLVFSQKTLAANGIITVSPQTGSYASGETFDVSVGIEGGTPFNAAKATVSTSPGLSVQNLTIGDCDFAFVRTPTQGDPSFAGVILGGSANTCTVYTLTLKAVSSGTAGITLSDTTVISYKGAVKLPISVQYGRYDIATGDTPVTSAQPSPTESPGLDIGGISLYDISFTFPLPKNTPLSEIQVVLDPSLSQRRTTVPTSNTVAFDNVPAGVHTIATYQNGKPLSKQIVNLTGKNKNFAFGVGTKKKSAWIWYLLAAAILLCLGILGIFLYRRFHKHLPV